MVTIFTHCGALKGSICNTDNGTEYYEFLGIPYAKPPVGQLRFKSPQLPERWDGVKDATTLSQTQMACQIDMHKGHPIGSEDCLYLNVYSPKLPINDDKFALLPVMFNIHGGGFNHGNGIIKTEVGPDYLIDNNVVVVSINYRLGIFGFLSLDIPEAAGNMGLKDQVQALKWVQNNINKFGGDKNNITIFGISAGAASVEYLILSPKSEGLFHRAILQSGSCLNHWAINFEPQILVHKIIEKLGFASSTDNPRAIYEYLMTCPPLLLAETSSKVIEESASERLFFGFVPTVEKDFGNDDGFLTIHPYRLLKEGMFYKVPVIKGYCEMEGYLTCFLKPSAVENLKTDGNYLRHWAYPVEINDHGKFNGKLSKVYNKMIWNPKEHDEKNIDFFSDYDFISGILLSGQIMSDNGVDVYLYKFSYDGKMNFFKNTFDFRKKGAAHADDVAFIYKTEISYLADECDIIVRDKITKLWTNFAKTSNPVWHVPVFSDISTWPKFTRSSSEYLNIDNQFTIESQSDTTKMDIFSEIYDKYQM